MEKVKHPPIISVTGTKGKSTVVYILASILNQIESTLRVDTTGYYVNGEQKGTLESSIRTNSLVPTVCPGRFLTAMDHIEDFSAILECSLGSSNPPGLGYRRHNVGVFTNVFEDHIGSTDRLNSKEDIAKAKRFIFERLHTENGHAVFNADDELVCAQLAYAPETAIRVPVGLKFDHFDLKGHLQNGGVAFTIADDMVVLRTSQGDTPIVKVNDIVWTFNGNFMPSVYNLLFVVGALYGRFEGKVPEKVWTLLRDSRLDPYGGRLTLLKAANGATILADYAHEKNSLCAVGDLAAQIKKDDGKVIGIVRLAYDRTDELIQDTAKTIAPHFDEFIVYDKIDGHLRKPKFTYGKFKMVVGRISEIFANALKAEGAVVTRIIREDEAIQHAAKIAQPGDIVVVIVADNIKRSIGFIQESFKAKFV